MGQLQNQIIVDRLPTKYIYHIKVIPLHTITNVIFFASPNILAIEYVDTECAIKMVLENRRY